MKDVFPDPKTKTRSPQNKKLTKRKKKPEASVFVLNTLEMIQPRFSAGGLFFSF
jgi:hypothetical protein